MKKQILLAGISILFTMSCYGALIGETERQYYESPGVVANKNGEWIGSDHLLNVGNQIEVVIEVIKPEKADFAISEEEILKKVRALLSAEGITTTADVVKNKAPLPMFHILLMVFPTGEQVIAFISCRLFESVNVTRSKIDPSTVFQAITWENQDMMIASKKDFTAELNKNIETAVNTFIDRYHFFQSMQK